MTNTSMSWAPIIVAGVAVFLTLLMVGMFLLVRHIQGKAGEQRGFEVTTSESSDESAG